MDATTISTVLAATLLTVAAYALAVYAYRRTGWNLLLPVLTGATIVVAVLMLAAVPYSTYRSGAAVVSRLARAA